MWGYEHCLHLGLSQRGARQAAPTPARPHTHWSAGWEGRAGPRLPKSLGGASTGEPDRTHTQQGLDTGSPGPASQHCHSQWQQGTPPELSGTSKGVGQCPTGHGWAPTTPRDIQVRICVTPVHIQETHRTWQVTSVRVLGYGSEQR